MRARIRQGPEKAVDHSQKSAQQSASQVSGVPWGRAMGPGVGCTSEGPRARGSANKPGLWDFAPCSHAVTTLTFLLACMSSPRTISVWGLLGLACGAFTRICKDAGACGRLPVPARVILGLGLCISWKSAAYIEIYYKELDHSYRS